MAEMVQCSRCFGRGYQPQARKSGSGIYIRTCAGCGGSGERPVKVRKPRKAVKSRILRKNPKRRTVRFGKRPAFGPDLPLSLSYKGRRIGPSHISHGHSKIRGEDVDHKVLRRRFPWDDYRKTGVLKLGSGWLAETGYNRPAGPFATKAQALAAHKAWKTSGGKIDRNRNNPKRKYIAVGKSEKTLRSQLKSGYGTGYALGKRLRLTSHSSTKSQYGYASTYKRTLARRMHHKAAKYEVYLWGAETIRADGYTPDGKYYGHVRGGANKIYSYTVESPQFTRPHGGEIRARDQKSAKAKILKEYPHAKFVK